MLVVEIEFDDPGNGLSRFKRRVPSRGGGGGALFFREAMNNLINMDTDKPEVAVMSGARFLGGLRSVADGFRTGTGSGDGFMSSSSRAYFFKEMMGMIEIASIASCFFI